MSSSVLKFPPETFLRQLHDEKQKRDFLRELYLLSPRQCWNKSTGKLEGVLQSATQGDLDFCCWCIHYIITGRIQIKKGHDTKISRSRKLDFLHEKFYEESSVKQLVRGPRAMKEEVLGHIHFFHSLFWYIFNDREKTQA